MVSVSVELSDRSVVASVAPERRRGRPMSRGWRRVAAGGSALLFCSAAGSLLILEAKTSTLQAEVFSHMEAQMRYRVDSGPRERLPSPNVGPYDRRLRYLGLLGPVAALARQWVSVGQLGSGRVNY